MARSVPFPTIRRAMDAVSTSEPEFPKLFHQQAETVTSDSLSVIQQPKQRPLKDLRKDDPLDGLVADKDIGEESVYRKVANWVFSQRRYLHRIEPTEDDIEVIDPIDLFHDSLLDEFLLLTRTSSEKRILLRELSEHCYNMQTVSEALHNCGHNFLRKPVANTAFELSNLVRGEGNNDRAILEKNYDTDRPFVSVSTVLQDYAIIDRDCEEIDVVTSSDSWSTSSNDHASTTYEVADEDIKAPDVTELDIVSLRCSEVSPRNNRHFDECTSLTYPTDVFEITTTVIRDNESETDENESDVWEDAKAIPHWLDCEAEEHLFTLPHRPFYYYRDRIKGCYRIIGVEDETVILFSGNDDDSIFYGDETAERNVTDISALRRSHSLGLLSSSVNKARGTLFSSPTRPSERQNGNPNEKRNDSGIEDGEDSLLCDNVIETSLSAKECRDLGRITKVIRSKESKTVKFQLDSSNVSLMEYFFVAFAVILFIISLIVYILDNVNISLGVDDVIFACRNFMSQD